VRRDAAADAEADAAAAAHAEHLLVQRADRQLRSWDGQHDRCGVPVDVRDDEATDAATDAAGANTRLPLEHEPRLLPALLDFRMQPGLHQ
jgi:hypothetical protein